MELVSLKLDPKDAKEEAGCAPTCDAPLYPYGTCLYLDEDEQKKLGITEMPDVGVEMPVTAVVKVIGTSQRETQDGVRKTLDLQITSMAIGAEEEDKEVQSAAARKLYPKA